MKKKREKGRETKKLTKIMMSCLFIIARDIFITFFLIFIAKPFYFPLCFVFILILRTKDASTYPYFTANYDTHVCTYKTRHNQIFYTFIQNKVVRCIQVIT